MVHASSVKGLFAFGNFIQDLKKKKEKIFNVAVNGNDDAPIVIEPGDIARSRGFTEAVFLFYLLFALSWRDVVQEAEATAARCVATLSDIAARVARRTEHLSRGEIHAGRNRATHPHR